MSAPEEDLRTDRLGLRPWRTDQADLDRLTDLYGRDEVTRWLGGAPTLPAVELVARWAEVHRRDLRYLCWAIERPDGVPAGTVLLKPLPNGVGEVEVGWHLHPDSWGTATPPRPRGR
ncbi:acetyltransferase (GNAT) family protein [Blastococcus xanthinilyticus]|uniref:Acetyltransferase (GNAT) family protein n=1 Tax=Blastococcus xanthinilyticus TaxID=1564164 RepID=A0A5S5D1A7_9ACTN|nr:GNAT family N-acetyltransferase [Blastococcus xanthinilyticus]TYP89134.1 acetyltransferase (GNAT) family protein [Blastococcus xanthinilyticus]